MYGKTYLIIYVKQFRILMSSRFGPRAVGSDGSDFRHRQKVATHYRDSVLNKYRMKVTLSLHALLLFLIWAKLSVYVLRWFDFTLHFVSSIQMPQPEFWEYWWIFSFIPSWLTVDAMQRNDSSAILKAYFLFLICGLFPIAIGAGLNLNELVTYTKHGRAEELFYDFPVVVIRYIFFAIALQVHVFAMYFCTKLGQAWQKATSGMSEANYPDSSLSNAKRQ
ncbi:Protein jagunal -like protein [Trichinella britovi]|uniref:Protein jagunal-like protein n=4 Tax=Trichinella TaxID=6333 RepID=A0A0V1DDA1_TRIBR|nr:Protein jagunal -like protein [Trichinella murrelli]KRY58979.1 Protein jagunal -like protein [Trichinella britovi]